jgi:hypothetical protein
MVQTLLTTHQVNLFMVLPADMTKTDLTLATGGDRNVNGSDEVDGIGKGLYGCWSSIGYSINSASHSCCSIPTAGSRSMLNSQVF